jgi:hypothetical protein
MAAASVSSGRLDLTWSKLRNCVFSGAAKPSSMVSIGAAAPAAPWVSSLPAHVPLPWLYWEAEELEELQDEDTIDEAFHLRSKFEQACQVRIICWLRNCSVGGPDSQTAVFS